MKKIYTAVFSKNSERGYSIRVLGLGGNPDEGLATWAPDIEDVELMARDLIAVYLDVPLDSFDLTVQRRADVA